jgi:hydrocephalus-inducing protein
LPYQNKQSNKLQVPIVFTPRDYVKYQEVITLNINNLHKIDVVIKGEGAPMKLELEKSEDQIIDFGI